jgi:hypothetical protein
VAVLGACLVEPDPVARPRPAGARVAGLGPGDRPAVSVEGRGHALTGGDQRAVTEALPLPALEGGLVQLLPGRLARHLLATGQAGVILATKVDRLSRSITDFIELVDASQREGWRLVVTGMQLDTSTAMGRFAARIMAEVAELERELIAERTSEALQVKKAQGTRLGPPERVRIPTPVVERIRTRRAEGATYTAICRELEAAGIPTARGASTWYPSTIQQVLDRARSTATA